MNAEHTSAEFKLHQTDKLPPWGPRVLSNHNRLFGAVGYGDSRGAGFWHIRDGVIASVKQVSLPAGSAPPPPSMYRSCQSVSGSQCKKKSVLADAPALAHGPPVADLCSTRQRRAAWEAPLVCHEELCEVNRWRLKEDTLYENSNLSCGQSNRLTEQEVWMALMGSKVKEKTSSTASSLGWMCTEGENKGMF